MKCLSLMSCLVLIMMSSNVMAPHVRQAASCHGTVLCHGAPHVRQGPPCSPIFANLRQSSPAAHVRQSSPAHPHVRQSSPIFANLRQSPPGDLAKMDRGARARVRSWVGEHGNHGADLRLYIFATPRSLANMGPTCGFVLSPQVGPMFANLSPCSPIFATLSLYLRQYIYAGQIYLRHLRQLWMCSRARLATMDTTHTFASKGTLPKKSLQTQAVGPTPDVESHPDMKRGT